MGMPPLHRVDHEPIFVPVMDDAWDMERIAREERIITGEEKPADGEVLPAWASIFDHPMTRYWSGASRGDLATVRGYLLANKVPTEIRCRRMSLPHWTESKQWRERKLEVAHEVACVRYGVVAVDNGFDEDGRALDLGGSPLSDSAITKLRRLLGDVGFTQLAIFIWRCNEEPTPSEVFR